MRRPIHFCYFSPKPSARIKRARLDLKEEERKAKMVVATHKVEFIPFYINALHPDRSKMVEYHFTRPILVDADETSHVCERKCHRLKIPFDDQELVKAKRKQKVAKAFVLM